MFQSAEVGGSVYDLLPRGAWPLFAVLRFHVVGAGLLYLAARGFARICPPFPLRPPATPR